MIKKILLLAFFTFIGNIHSQWIFQNTNIDGTNRTIFFTDSLSGYIGGYSHFSVDEYIITTTDGGDSWNRNSIVGNPSSIFFINRDVGYCTTYYEHHIYKTTDHGINWEIIYSDSLAIWSVYFLNDSLGWAVGGEFWTNGLILKTTDYGNSWQRTLSPTMNSLKSIIMLNDTVGFITGGHPSKIWRTESGGNNWELILQDIPNNSFQSLNDIAFLNDSIGFAVGSKLFKTSDGGTSWEQLSFPVLSYHSVFTFKNNCWITANSHVLYTNDYGASWIPINIPDGKHMYDAYFLNDSLGWFCGIGSNILKTYSGGLADIIYPKIPTIIKPEINAINVDIPVEFEWSEQNYCYFQIQVCNDSLFQSPIIDSIIIENKIIIDSHFLSAYNSYYWKVRSKNMVGISEWSDTRKFTTGIVLGVKDGKIFSHYSLNQNYPNPFNPITKIEYSIPKSEFVTLKMFDILGKEITSLVNEEKLPGNYSVKFDASKLTSGIYFYRLKAGGFTETKKLILMK